MWGTFYDEGAIKTVIKHHAKRLPMSTDIEAIFERDEFMQHGEDSAPKTLTAEPVAHVSRLDALEHSIEPHVDEDPPVETPEIEAQAEELEAEIVEDHPGQAIADRIIAEINSPECNAVLDVAAVLNRHSNDIAAMLPEDGARVEIAADKRRQQIRAEQKAAKEPAA